MKEGGSVLTSLSLDKFGVDGGSISSRCSKDSKCSSFSSSSAADEDVLGNDISVVSPFSDHISRVKSNEASTCSYIMSRSISNSR